VQGSASSFEVTPEATDAYNDVIHGRLARSVFIQCTSWYRKDGNGKVFSTFPGPMSLFWWWLQSPNWGHYKTTGGEDWVKQQKLKTVYKALKVLAFIAALLWSSSHWGVVERFLKSSTDQVWEFHCHRFLPDLHFKIWAGVYSSWKTVCRGVLQLSYAGLLHNMSISLW
jgi:hypothetical protein